MADILQVIEEKGLPSYLICKRLPHGLGRGIFLHPEAEPLVKGQVIAPYAGEASIVPPHKSDGGLYAFTPLEGLLLKEKEHPFFDRRRYDPTRRYTFKVDAIKKGNFTRFVNHSVKPNIEAHLYTIPSNAYGVEPSPLEVVYFVKKTIRPGEQLLVCYEGEKNCYWDGETKPFPMGPKTFQLNQALQVIQSLT